MTAAIEGGAWSAARPGRILPPGKEPAPILQEAGWAPGLVWTAEKLVPTGIRSRNVQHVDSRYTDWATRLISRDCSSEYNLQINIPLIACVKIDYNG